VANAYCAAMRTKASSVLIAAATVVFVAACGGASSSQSKRADTVTTTTTKQSPPTASRPARVPSAPELDAAVLRIEDVPTGYAVSPPSNDTADQGVCNKQPVSKLVPSVVKAQRGFQKATLGPFISEVLLAYADPATAGSAIQTLRSETQGCTSYQQKGSDGTTTNYQLAPLSFPRLGDDTFAVQVNTSGGFFPVTANLVVLRRTNLVLVVATVGTLAPAADIEPLVRTALDRTSGLAA
jgi:hypothetical protein